MEGIRKFGSEGEAVSALTAEGLAGQAFVFLVSLDGIGKEPLVIRRFLGDDKLAIRDIKRGNLFKVSGTISDYMAGICFVVGPMIELSSDHGVRGYAGYDLRLFNMAKKQGITWVLDKGGDETRFSVGALGMGMDMMEWANDKRMAEYNREKVRQKLEEIFGA